MTIFSLTYSYLFMQKNRTEPERDIAEIFQLGPNILEHSIAPKNTRRRIKNVLVFCCCSLIIFFSFSFGLAHVRMRTVDYTALFVLHEHVRIFSRHLCACVVEHCVCPVVIFCWLVARTHAKRSRSFLLFAIHSFIDCPIITIWLVLVGCVAYEHEPLAHTRAKRG